MAERQWDQASGEASMRSPVVQYWHSPDPPAHIVTLTRSFAELNPERPHLLFDERSAERFIAEHVGGREADAFRACGPAAMQADYFRCCAILHLGGIWADVGYECADNLGPLLGGAATGELFTSLSSGYILMNGLFAFAAPGHPFLRLAIDVSTALIEMRWEGKVIEVTGPLVMTSIYRLHLAGSERVFLRDARAEMPASRRAHFTRYARLVSELIGGPERASGACSGMRVSPAQSQWRWVRRPVRDLPHRRPVNHWPSVGTDVYRTVPKATQ